MIPITRYASPIRALILPSSSAIRRRDGAGATATAPGATALPEPRANQTLCPAARGPASSFVSFLRIGAIQGTLRRARRLEATDSPSCPWVEAGPEHPGTGGAFHEKHDESRGPFPRRGPFP